jgi:hypothetical protein
MDLEIAMPFLSDTDQATSNVSRPTFIPESTAGPEYGYGILQSAPGVGDTE